MKRKLSLHGAENNLQNAVNNNDYEALEKMLSNGKDNLDINYMYPPGVSLLHQACVLGDIDVIKLMVDKGADVNAKTWAQWTPAKLAVTYGHFEVAQLLLDSGARVDDIVNGFQVDE